MRKYRLNQEKKNRKTNKRRSSKKKRRKKRNRRRRKRRRRRRRKSRGVRRNTKYITRSIQIFGFKSSQTVSARPSR